MTVRFKPKSWKPAYIHHYIGFSFFIHAEAGVNIAIESSVFKFYQHLFVFQWNTFFFCLSFFLSFFYFVCEDKIISSYQMFDYNNISLDIKLFLFTEETFLWEFIYSWSMFLYGNKLCVNKSTASLLQEVGMNSLFWTAGVSLTDRLRCSVIWEGLEGGLKRVNSDGLNIWQVCHLDNFLMRLYWHV